MNYLKVEEIKEAFGNHLTAYLGYSKGEVAVAVSDFPDPYTNCYLNEEYVAVCEIEGEVYEQYASYTAFERMGIDAPPFCFYTFYCKADIPTSRVGEYKNARKLYQVEDLDDSDFPV